MNNPFAPTPTLTLYRRFGNRLAMVFLLLFLLAFGLAAHGQSSVNLNGLGSALTNNVPPPPPPNTNAANLGGYLQSIVDLVSVPGSNLTFVVYGSYFTALPKHIGGGVGAFYPLYTNGVNLLVGPRLQWANGGFLGLNGSASIGVPLRITSWLEVEPLLYAGAGAVLSGTSVQGIKIPGTPQPDWQSPFLISGYGAEVHLFNIGRFTAGAFYEVEHWYGTPVGNVHNIGAAFRLPL